MDNENKRNGHTDFSGVFDIDDSIIPDKIIERAPDAKKVTEPILMSEEAQKLLPKDARKAIRKEKKQEEKTQKKNKRRKNAVLVLSVIVAVFVISFIAGIIATDMKTPAVSVEKPVVQTISRYHNGTGVSLSSGGVKTAVFIDNDYDVHYIEKGQTAEITVSEGVTVRGTVTDISEISPDSPLIETYYEILTTVKPLTGVYAVHVTYADGTEAPAEGTAVNVKVLTETSEDALTLPSSAVCLNGNKYYVWVYSSLRHTLTMREVNVGISADGRTEILRGIKKSDRIAVSFSCPAEQLYDGIKVKKR